MNDKPWCCYNLPGDTRCTIDAEFRIETHRRDGGSAGPDIYGDETEACEIHVGALLGWQPEAEQTEEIVWTVRQL